MIRRVKPEDSQRIMEIRNHPRVRNKSNNSEEIDFVKHDQWFNHKYFDSDDNLCFVLERENKVVGYCRLDLDNGSYIISIAIDPDFHGQGLGRQLLGQVLQEVGAGKNIYFF